MFVATEPHATVQPVFIPRGFLREQESQRTRRVRSLTVGQQPTESELNRRSLTVSRSNPTSRIWLACSLKRLFLSNSCIYPHWV